MKIVINKKELGNRIFKIRSTMKLTLEDFGKLFNASKSSVLGWENGNNTPNRTRLEKIAKLGNMTFNELLYGNVKEFLYSNIDTLVIEYNLIIFAEKDKQHIIDFLLKNKNLTINDLDAIINYTINNIDYAIPVITQKQFEKWNNIQTKLDFEMFEKNVAEYGNKRMALLELLSLTKDHSLDKIYDLLIIELQTTIAELKKDNKVNELIMLEKTISDLTSWYENSKD